MKKNKQIGVFMDHSSAVLMEISGIIIGQKHIESEFTKQEKFKSLQKGENFVHSKEKAFQSSYYKEIGDVIKSCHDVILFGPTDAKSELNNLLKEDQLFDNIKIEVQNSKKMSEVEMRIFVREYFKLRS